MSDAFKKHGDWIRFFAMIAFFCALHFFDGRYVTKGDYSTDQAKIEVAFKTISNTLTGLDRSIALLEAARRVQDDHETRIRALEAKSKVSFFYENQNPSLDPHCPLPVYGNGLDLVYYGRPWAKLTAE